MANLGYLQLTRNCYQKCQFCSNPPSGVHLDEEEMRRNIDRLVETTQAPENKPMRDANCRSSTTEDLRRICTEILTAA